MPLYETHSHVERIRKLNDVQRQLNSIISLCQSAESSKNNSIINREDQLSAFAQYQDFLLEAQHQYDELQAEMVIIDAGSSGGPPATVAGKYFQPRYVWTPGEGKLAYFAFTTAGAPAADQTITAFDEFGNSVNSFTTDLAVGDYFVVSGAEDPANDGLYTITATSNITLVQQSVAYTPNAQDTTAVVTLVQKSL